MNEEQKKKIIIRNAFVWSLAFITPPIVMTIVDATTRETPSQNMIAIFSSAALMGLYAVSNAVLVSAIASASVEGQGDGDASESPK